MTEQEKKHDRTRNHEPSLVNLVIKKVGRSYILYPQPENGKVVRIYSNTAHGKVLSDGSNVKVNNTGYYHNKLRFYDIEKGLSIYDIEKVPNSTDKHWQTTLNSRHLKLLRDNSIDVVDILRELND